MVLDWMSCNVTFVWAQYRVVHLFFHFQHLPWGVVKGWNVRKYFFSFISNSHGLWWLWIGCDAMCTSVWIQCRVVLFRESCRFLRVRVILIVQKKHIYIQDTRSYLVEVNYLVATSMSRLIFEKIYVFKKHIFYKQMYSRLSAIYVYVTANLQN